MIYNLKYCLSIRPTLKLSILSRVLDPWSPVVRALQMLGEGFEVLVVQKLQEYLAEFGEEQ